jgi:hypothetical protein
MANQDLHGVRAYTDLDIDELHTLATVLVRNKQEQHKHKTLSHPSFFFSLRFRQSLTHSSLFFFVLFVSFRWTTAVTA